MKMKLLALLLWEMLKRGFWHNILYLVNALSIISIVTREEISYNSILEFIRMDNL